MLSHELFEFISSAKNITMDFVSDTLQWLKMDAKNAVFLYGAGNHLQYVVQFCRKYGIPIRAILDTFRGGNDESYQGIKMIRYEDFLRDPPDEKNTRFIISAPSASEEILPQIHENFPHSVIFCGETQIYLGFIPNVDLYRKYLLTNWEALGSFADELQDNLSRKTLECVIKGRISGDISYFRACAAPNQYYPKDIISFSQGEIMVELGSNDGQTLQEFIQQCPDYKAVYCFEPEKRLLPKLETIQRKELKNKKQITIIPKGAWDRVETLHYQVDDTLAVSGSLVLDNGNANYVEIETELVDEAVSQPITFLKMDIEGAELRALHGSAKQITAYHPKIAVCVYHKPEDFLEIHDYLKSLNPAYRFYLRHHENSCATETVLYAV